MINNLINNYRNCRHIKIKKKEVVKIKYLINTQTIATMIRTLIAYNKIKIMMKSNRVASLQLNLRILLSNKCSFDRGEELKWINSWLEKSSKNKTHFGQNIKDILAIWTCLMTKIKKTMSKIVRAKTSLIVISVTLNPNTTMSQEKTKRKWLMN